MKNELTLLVTVEWDQMAADPSFLVWLEGLRAIGPNHLSVDGAGVRVRVSLTVPEKEISLADAQALTDRAC